MVVDMVSVVMEGAVVMNSFPPRAVPSICGQRKESSERDREREARFTCSICPLGSRQSHQQSDRLCE